MADKDDFIGRLRVSDQLSAAGYSLPLGQPRVAKAVVKGVCAQGCRLIRVWAHEDGWRVVVDGGRVPMEDWSAIASSQGFEEPDEPTVVVGRRKLRGDDLVVDRDPGTWRTAKAITGCRHGAGLASVAPVASALMGVLDGTRKPGAQPVTLHVVRASA